MGLSFLAIGVLLYIKQLWQLDVLLIRVISLKLAFDGAWAFFSIRTK